MKTKIIHDSNVQDIWVGGRANVMLLGCLPAVLHWGLSYSAELWFLAQRDTDVLPKPHFYELTKFPFLFPPKVLQLVNHIVALTRTSSSMYSIVHISYWSSLYTILCLLTVIPWPHLPPTYLQATFTYTFILLVCNGIFEVFRLASFSHTKISTSIHFSCK